MKPKLKAEAKVKTWEDDETTSVTENMLPATTVEEPVKVIFKIEKFYYKIIYIYILNYILYTPRHYVNSHKLTL